MRFSLDFLGDQQINRTLARFHDRAADCRPVFDRMADYIAEEGRDNFDTEGQSQLGRKWTPLSPRYAAWKRRHYPGRKILVRTGRLRREVTQRPFGIEEIGKHSMRIGTALRYADFHQHGRLNAVGANHIAGRSTGSRGGLPRRPPFALNQKNRTQLTKMLQRWLRNGELL